MSGKSEGKTTKDEEKYFPEEPDWENSGLIPTKIPVLPEAKTDYKFYIESYDYDEIIDGLIYLGEYEAGLTEDVVKKIKIIVNVTPDEHTVKFPWITYHHFKIEDDEDADIYSILPETTKILQEAYSNSIPVLVHCFAGISRSSTVVIAFIMKQFGFNFEKALKFVVAKRDCVDPNCGFIEQLKKWEKEVCQKQSEDEESKHTQENNI